MLSDKEIICPNNLLNAAHKKKGVVAGIVNAGKPLPMLSVMDAVNETDKATSPFANFVKTFDVIPPGAAAIIITPRAISGDISKNIPRIFNNINATIGKIIN